MVSKCEPLACAFGACSRSWFFDARVRLRRTLTQLWRFVLQAFDNDYPYDTSILSLLALDLYLLRSPNTAFQSHDVAFRMDLLVLRFARDAF